MTGSVDLFTASAQPTRPIHWALARAGVAREQPPSALSRRLRGHARDRAHSPARCSGRGETLPAEFLQSSWPCRRRTSPLFQERVRHPPLSRPCGKRRAPPKAGCGGIRGFRRVAFEAVSLHRTGAARRDPDWFGRHSSHWAKRICLPGSADCRFRLWTCSCARRSSHAFTSFESTTELTASPPVETGGKSSGSSKVPIFPLWFSLTRTFKLVLPRREHQAAFVEEIAGQQHVVRFTAHLHRQRVPQHSQPAFRKGRWLAR